VNLTYGATQGECSISDHKATRVSKWLGLLLLLSLLITLLPAGVAGAAFKRCDKLYKVKRGDTLASIASKHGLDADTIAKKNNLEKLRSKYLYSLYIFVDEELCIPEKIDKESHKLDDKYTTIPARYFTAIRSGEDVFITMNYSRRYPTIKIGPAGKKVNTYIQVKNPVIESDQKYHFELPDKLKNVNNLQACIRTARKTFYWQCASIR
jgi:LysM repeat protein